MNLLFFGRGKHASEDVTATIVVKDIKLVLLPMSGATGGAPLLNIPPSHRLTQTQTTATSIAAPQTNGNVSNSSNGAVAATTTTTSGTRSASPALMRTGSTLAAAAAARLVAAANRGRSPSPQQPQHTSEPLFASPDDDDNAEVAAAAAAAAAAMGHSLSAVSNAGNPYTHYAVSLERKGKAESLRRTRWINTEFRARDVKAAEGLFAGTEEEQTSAALLKLFTSQTNRGDAFSNSDEKEKNIEGNDDANGVTSTTTSAGAAAGNAAKGSKEVEKQNSRGTTDGKEAATAAEEEEEFVCDDGVAPATELTWSLLNTMAFEVNFKTEAPPADSSTSGALSPRKKDKEEKQKEKEKEKKRSAKEEIGKLVEAHANPTANAAAIAQQTASHLVAGGSLSPQRSPRAVSTSAGGNVKTAAAAVGGTPPTDRLGPFASPSATPPLDGRGSPQPLSVDGYQHHNSNSNNSPSQQHLFPHQYQQQQKFWGAIGLPEGTTVKSKTTHPLTASVHCFNAHQAHEEYVYSLLRDASSPKRPFWGAKETVVSAKDLRIDLSQCVNSATKESIHRVPIQLPAVFESKEVSRQKEKEEAKREKKEKKDLKELKEQQKKAEKGGSLGATISSLMGGGKEEDLSIATAEAAAAAGSGRSPSPSINNTSPAQHSPSHPSGGGVVGGGNRPYVVGQPQNCFLEVTLCCVGIRKEGAAPASAGDEEKERESQRSFSHSNAGRDGKSSVDGLGGVGSGGAHNADDRWSNNGSGAAGAYASFGNANPHSAPHFSRFASADRMSVASSQRGGGGGGGSPPAPLSGLRLSHNLNANSNTNQKSPSASSFAPSTSGVNLLSLGHYPPQAGVAATAAGTPPISGAPGATNGTPEEEGRGEQRLPNTHLIGGIDWSRVDPCDPATRYFLRSLPHLSATRFRPAYKEYAIVLDAVYLDVTGSTCTPAEARRFGFGFSVNSATGSGVAAVGGGSGSNSSSSGNVSMDYICNALRAPEDAATVAARVKSANGSSAAFAVSGLYYNHAIINANSNNTAVSTNSNSNSVVARGGGRGGAGSANVSNSNNNAAAAAAASENGTSPSKSLFPIADTTATASLTLSSSDDSSGSPNANPNTNASAVPAALAGRRVCDFSTTPIAADSAAEREAAWVICCSDSERYSSVLVGSHRTTATSRFRPTREGPAKVSQKAQLSFGIIRVDEQNAWTTESAFTQPIDLAAEVINVENYPDEGVLFSAVFSRGERICFRLRRRCFADPQLHMSPLLNPRPFFKPLGEEDAEGRYANINLRSGGGSGGVHFVVDSGEFEDDGSDRDGEEEGTNDGGQTPEPPAPLGAMPANLLRGSLTPHGDALDLTGQHHAESGGRGRRHGPPIPSPRPRGVEEGATPDAFAVAVTSGAVSRTATSNNNNASSSSYRRGADLTPSASVSLSQALTEAAASRQPSMQQRYRHPSPQQHLDPYTNSANPTHHNPSATPTDAAAAVSERAVPLIAVGMSDEEADVRAAAMAAAGGPMYDDDEATAEFTPSVSKKKK